jgi:hypothetical protein
MRLLTLLSVSLLSLSLTSAFGIIVPASLSNGTVGLPYPPSNLPNPNANAKVQFTSDKHSPPTTFWAAKGVPPGLTLNRSGVLSGKPRQAGNFTITVEVRQTRGSRLVDSRIIPIRINDTAPPTIQGPFILPGGKFDQAYQSRNNGYPLSAAGGIPFVGSPQYPTGYNWELISGRTSFQRLPTGMTLNGRGVISGTPVWSPAPAPRTPQTYNLQVRATDLVGKSSTANFTLVIAPPDPPEILTDCPLPEGLEKDRYPVVELKARFGRPSYRWPRPAGLPPGLVWDERGFISGTPTTRGTYPITLQVVDANGLTANKSCQIVIRPAPEIIVKPIFTCARVGDAYCEEIEARGGDQPYTWSATGMPPGMTIARLGNSLSKAQICGNFTTAGNYTIRVTARDQAGRTDTEDFPIVVRPRLEITTASPLPFGIRGFPYPRKTGAPTVTINATGGWPPYSWQWIGGQLPPGLSLGTATGNSTTITGTPIKTGTYKFTLRAKDSCGTPEKWVDKEFEITIYDPITILPDPNSCLTVNRSFSLNVTASGGAAPYAWGNFTASSANYTLTVPDPSNSRVARLSRIPSQPGLVTFTFNVTSLGITESFTINYTVSPELKITSACPPAEVTSGKAISPFNLTATGGKGNYTWNATLTRNGSVVGPLSIANSRLNWTPPSTPGNHTIRFVVRDECGNTDSKECDIIIYPALTCNQTLNLPCLFNGKILPQTPSSGPAFSASGGKPPYNWTILPITGNKTLPLGLSQNGSVLFGTIAENGTFSFRVNATDSLLNSCSQTYSLVVHSKLAIAASSPMPSGKVSQAYSATVNATGGNGNYSWRLDPATIPATGFTNIQINSSTGVITGTPTLKGFYKVKVVLEDSCGQRVDKEVEIPVDDSVYTITPQTEINIWFDASGSMSEVLPVLQQMQKEVLKPCLLQFFNGNGTLFDERVRVRQYYDERTFLALNTAGSSNAITQVINLVFQDEAMSVYHSSPFFDTARTTWYENDISGLRNTFISKPEHIRGVVFRVTGVEGFLSLLDAVKNGTSAYAGAFGLAGQNDISVVRNVARPGGGVGTPSPLPGSPMYYGNQIIESLNSMGFTLRLCDKAQDPPVSLTPKIVSQSPLEGPVVGLPYTGILSAVGGVLPYTWSLPTGTLPAGLSFNATTGTVAGTPTAVQTANFSVRVTDTNNASDLRGFSLTVVWQPLAVEWSEETTTVPAGQPAGQETFTASGGNGTYTWSIANGSLPPGITLSDTSGASVFLGGTPTLPGTYEFRVRVTSAGQEMNVDVTYIVEDDFSDPGVPDDFF